MRKQIDQNIKNKIIEKIKAEGLKVADVAQEFGINPNTIYGWFKAENSSNPSVLEVARLRRENNELKQIIGGLTLSMERGKKNSQS